MVIRHRLASRAPPPTLYASYDAELLSWSVRRNDPCNFYLALFTDHTILSTLAAEQLRPQGCWLDSRAHRGRTTNTYP